MTSSFQAPQACYSLFGLRVLSEVQLDEPRFEPAAGAAAIRIRRASLGHLSSASTDKVSLSLAGGDALLEVREVARYLVRAGEEILVDEKPGAYPGSVELFLLGSAFGILLHQRGMLPLHANVIDVGGHGIAFAGPSGAGKSTIASLFHDRGFSVLADDVCAVGFDMDGVPLAQPGPSRLKLWGDALRWSGRDPEEYRPVLDRTDKFIVPLPPALAPAEIPLTHVYVLGRAEGPDPSIRRLVGVEAMRALVSNTYRGEYLPYLKCEQRHFADCLRLVKAVDVFEFNRPWRKDRFEEQVNEICNHLRGRKALADQALLPSAFRMNTPAETARSRATR